jgi:hypothetical protein
METNFKYTESLVSENSYTILDKEDNVELDVTIGIKDEEYGYFEFYDIKTGGDSWYAEGGLWFKGKELVDYDGVFDLPDFIKDKLIELGYTVNL